MAATQASLNGSMPLTSLNPDAVPRCNTHRKRLKFFCSKHQLLLCSVCAVKRHRTCEEVLTINEACEDKRNEGNKVLDNYNQKISLIENAIVERKAAKKLLDTNAQEIHNEVHEITEKLIDLVKHEERMIIETVQSMRERESEILDKDIGGLEDTCNVVKRARDTLSQSLKFSDVDLIYAVIKEKQNNEDGINVESVVKKRFKEIDFKFTVSPHITSFMKHFKNLGQVMLSEDRGSANRVSRSNMSTPVNDTASMAPGNSGSMSTRQTVASDESYISARERWARDRRRQMQQQTYQNRSPSSDESSRNDSVFYPEQSPSAHNQTRRQPMRALPISRPITPDVYNNSASNSRPREFVPRPMSTPPVEANTYTGSPKSRDVNRFQSNRYRTARPEPVYIPERTLPTPRHEYPRDQNRQVSQSNVRNGSPNEVPRRQGTDALSPMSPRNRPVSPWSPTQPPNRQNPAAFGSSPPSFSIVSVKENDVNFGRSFAAVQIHDTGTADDLNSEQSYPPTYQSKATISLMPVTSGDESSEHEGNNGTVEHSKHRNQVQQTSAMSRSQSTSPRLNESLGFNVTNGLRQSRPITDGDKVRRWVMQTSFTSHGISSKRLISGIAMMYDGRIVLVDQEHYCVQLYSKYHKFVAELKLDSRPFDVAVVSDNKVVVSLQSERVLKFILVTGEGLTSVADLGVPCDTVCYGICKGVGIYSVCCGDEVWILSEEGRVVNRLKSDINGSSLFIQAEYIAVDANGSVLYVSDSGSNTILAIHADGRRLWEFTYQGFKPSGLKCIDSYVLVCDHDQHRILMLNKDGQVIKQSLIGRLENPRALCFNDAGSQLVVTQMKYDAIVSPPKPIHIYVLN